MFCFAAVLCVVSPAVILAAAAGSGLVFDREHAPASPRRGEWVE